MKNLKKTWYSSRYLMSVFMLLIFADIGEMQAQCSDLNVTIEAPVRTSICQDGATFRITINNTGLYYFINGNFTITADPSGNDFVTLESISGAGFSAVSGLGTGVMTANHTGFNAFTTYVLDVQVAFSCDLWDNMGLLNGHVLDIIGYNPINTCFHGISDPYDIGYATVEPDPETPPDIIVDLGEPFSAYANLLVSSSSPSCDSDFILFADFDDCINYDNANIIVTDFGYCSGSYFVPPGNITPTANGLEIVINLSDCPFFPSPPPKACLGPGNFAGQYGDIEVGFHNLKKTCCGDGGSADIVFSTTTCDYDSPASCTSGGQLETQFTSGIQTVWTPNGGVPALSIAPLSLNGIKICNDDQPFELEFTICNTSSVDAYDIDLSFNNEYGLNVTNASITYLGNETFLPLSGNDPNIGPWPVGGIGDANMDGVNEELEAGGCFTFWVQLTYPIEVSCLFDALSCPANFHRRPYMLNLTFDNQCSTIIPKATAYSPAPFNDLSATTAYVDPQLGNLPEFLFADTEYDIGLCMGTLDQLGWDIISNHGDLNQCVTVTSNYPNVTYTTMTGNFGTINATGGNNFVLPPGLTFDSECALVSFEFSCVNAPREPIHFDFAIKAFWDDCPDCSLVLACPEVDLYTFCPDDTIPGVCPRNLSGSIINTTVAGQTTPLGEQRAYPCDEVRMVAEGTLDDNYSGPISACYLYQDGIPAVFTGGKAELSINNIDVATATLFSSAGNIFQYNFPGIFNIAGDAVVRVTIKVNVESNPLNNYWQNLDLFAVGIGFGEDFCKVTGEFSVLDYDIDMIPTGGGSCCSGLSRSYRIEYTGGGFGEDFPNMDRVLGQFTGDFTATVDQGSITAVVDQTSGSHSLGLSGTTVSWNANDLVNPLYKVSFNATIHRFSIYYEPGCGETGVGLDVTGAWESGTYAGRPPCLVSHPINEMLIQNITPPIVNTVIIADVVEHENTAILNTNTWVTHAKACNPWIQLEFDPALVTIDYAGTGNTAIFDNGTKAVLAVELPMMDVGAEQLTQFIVTFDDACDGPLVVDLFGSHYCSGGEFPSPALCSDDLECEDSNDQASITILPSEVNFAGYDCDDKANECEVHYFSFVLDNQEDGDSYDVGLLADLPPEFSVVEAYYDYPYSGNVNNCDATGTSISNFSDFDNGGWLIDTDGVWGEGAGFLPGQSHDNSTAAQRTFHIVLGIIGSCDVDENNLLASFEAIGTHNCGDEIDLPPFEAELDVESTFVIPEVEVTVAAKIECINGFGELIISVDFVDDNLDIDPDQVFKLSIVGGAGYDLFCFNPREFPYGDASFSCYVRPNSPSCKIKEYKGSFILSTCLAKECNGEVCDLESEILVEDDFYFDAEHQQLIISDIAFDEEFCNEGSKLSSQITVTIDNINVDIGTNATFQLWCDVNGNCIQDQGDVFLQDVGVLITGAPSQQFNYTMSPAEFHDLCGDGQVVVTLSSTNNYCLCVSDACETLCCPCPEWDVSFMVDGIDICFDIVSPNDITLEPDCVEYYADGQLHAIGFAAPWCFGLPEGTKEVCLFIYSDQIIGNGCDTIKKTVKIQSEASASLKKCEGECQYDWCAKLNECQLDITFDGAFSYQGEGLFTIDATAIIIHTNGVAPTYAWTMNGNPISNSESWSIADLGPGEYVICLIVETTLESGEVCKDEICHTITIGLKGLYDCENFFADFTWKVGAGNEYEFSDATKGPGKVISWSWEIDRKQTSTNPSFSQTLTNGIYRVKLTVTYLMDKTICTKSISKWVVVGSNRELRLSNADDSFESSVFPNPHIGTTKLQINAENHAKLLLTLYDMYGSIVWTENVVLKDGSLNKTLVMERFASGVYILVVNGDGYNQTHKIVLSR